MIPHPLYKHNKHGPLPPTPIRAYVILEQATEGKSFDNYGQESLQHSVYFMISYKLDL